MIEKHIDYVAFAAYWPETEFIEQDFKPIPPIAWYKRGYYGTHGFRYYFGNPNSKKALCVASGKALEFKREYGFRDAELANWILDVEGTVSRLDIALTKYLTDSFFTVSDVSAWFAMGWIKSSHTKYGAKTIARLVEDGGLSLETLYIGDMENRGERGIFRAYDKGLEWDIGDYLVTRLEVEDRGKKAHNSLKRIAAGVDTASVFRSRFDCEAQEFQDAISAPVAEITRGEGREKREMDEKIAGRWKWLINQVAPALREAIEHEASQDKLKPLLFDFLAAAGLLSEMNSGAEYLAQQKYYEQIARMFPSVFGKDS